MLYPDFSIAVSDLSPEAQRVLSSGGYEVSIYKLPICHGITQYQVMRKGLENKRISCLTRINASSARSREDFIRVLSINIVREARKYDVHHKETAGAGKGGYDVVRPHPAVSGARRL